jgi:MFS family permease
VFRRLLASFALNELAWSVGTLALAVLVYRRTGSALGSTGFFLCSQVAPALLSTPLVAKLDRRAPARVLPVMYALEALLFGALAWMTSRFALAPVLALALLDGVVALASRSLAHAARAQVLKPLDLLEEGSALTSSAFSLCYMIGPLLGGIVVAAGGTVAALLANSALFAVMAFVLSTADLPRGVGDDEHGQRRLRAALAHVRANDWLERLLILQVIGMIFFTISVPVEVVFAEHTLRAGAGGYGALMACWGAGAVLGSAAYTRWRRRPAATLISVSGLMLGLGFLVMAVAPSLLAALLGAAVAGSGNAVVLVATRTLIQSRTPDRFMALMMSLMDASTTLAPGLGILAGGVITVLAGPRVAFAVAAFGSLAFALVVAVALRLPPPLPPAGDDVQPPESDLALLISSAPSTGTLV